MVEFSAGSLLVDQLVAEGTKVVFGTAASARSPLIEEITTRRVDLRYATAMHEQIACTMAMGYAQASGKPGVVYLTAAPGLTNALSGVYNALRARVPIVVLVDQQDTQILNDDPPLSGNLMALASGACKWSCELKSASEIGRFVRRAFHEALTPPRGPVVLSLPSNIVLNPSVGMTVMPSQSSPLGPADTAFLKKTAAALINASNPCIIAGNEVSQYRARREAVSLAEVLGCPTYVEPIPTGVNFPNRHPQYGGIIPLNLADANRLLQHHDVVLILGMQNRVPPRQNEPPLLPKSAFIIQLNIESSLAGRSLPCQLNANADIAESLSRMRAEIQLQVDSKWVSTANERAKVTISSIAAKREELENSYTNPTNENEITIYWLLRLLDMLRPETASIISDLAFNGGHVANILSLSNSYSYFSSSGSVPGYAASAALGVQWASTSSMIICLTSLESFMHAPQVLSTAKHFDLPVKFIVVHGPPASGIGYQPSNLFDRPYFLHEELPTADLASLATALGIPSLRVSKVKELEPALKHMFKEMKASLIEVCVTE